MNLPSNTITLLVDTNLFFECKALDQLPWKELGFETIFVLVTKPVLDEIDKHKKASGRTRKRALEIFKRIRAMLQNDESEDVIQEENPRVIFKLDDNTPVDESLADQLNKNKNDDRLIGILSTLVLSNPQMEFRFFTHDTGPAQTASSLSLPFGLIDDSWLRPEKESDEKKKITALENDLEIFRSQEPHITIGLEGENSANGTISLTRKLAERLTDAQLDQLIEKLKAYFPEKKGFTHEPSTLGDKIAKKAGAAVEYVPPSKEDISVYSEEKYPNWLQACREIFSECHKSLTGPLGRIPITYVMENVGSRPASKVRVNFRADGDIWFYRFSDGEEDRDEFQETPSIKKSVTLPQPPCPPRLTRIVKQTKPEKNTDIAKILPRNAISELARLGAPTSRLMQDIQKLGALSQPYKDILGSLPNQGIVTPVTLGPDLRIPIRHKHDPEGFYFTDWPSDLPVNKGALTCDLWRHQSDKQHFKLEVAFDSEGRLCGSIFCEVHAENITKPVSVRTKVNVENQSINTYDVAEKAIRKLRSKCR